MDSEKIKRLQAQGWTVGNADDFLGLSAQESLLVDLKLKLSRAVRERRLEQHISQKELAERMKSSQSRVAKIEANHASISMDILMKALVFTGATPLEIADVISSDNLQNQSKSKELEPIS
jgi:ribosome-binding protein aMBF1 (putative translation factor)